jgi:hypothetical protein
MVCFRYTIVSTLHKSEIIIIIMMIIIIITHIRTITPVSEKYAKPNLTYLVPSTER